MDSFLWYSELIKPSWAPQAEIFGPVWTILYLLIAVSFIYVFYKWYKRDVSYKIAFPFALNILFNVSFTPIQFGLKNNLLAFIDIVLVLLTLIWALYVIYPKYKWVAWINIPYLLWVSFATILQISITVLNF